MKITFDPAKRDWTLRERGLDFAEAGQVFAGVKLESPDERRDYGELRMVTVGYLRKRTHGDRVLDPARRSPARIFHEEGQ